MPSLQPLPGVLPPFRPGDPVRVPNPGSRIGGTLQTRVKGEPVPGGSAGEWLIPVSGAGLVPVGEVRKAE